MLIPELIPQNPLAGGQGFAYNFIAGFAAANRRTILVHGRLELDNLIGELDHA